MASSIALYNGQGNPASGSWLAYQDSGIIPPGTASFTNVSGGVRLTTDQPVYAGYSNYALNYSLNPLNPSISTNLKNTSFPILDRAQGFSLTFKLQLNSESHAGSDRNLDGRDDRAGFSVVLIGDDLKGIELGFWGDRVFAQEDSTNQIDKSQEPDGTPAKQNLTLFTQAEFVANDATTALAEYELAIVGETYKLSRGSITILTGRVRDYTNFIPQSIFGVTPPSPYRQKNLLFLGDNTPAASATATLGEVAITTNLVTNAVKNSQLVWQNTASGAVALWNLQNGTYQTGLVLPAVPGPDWQIKGIKDFDNDGDQDVFWRNTKTGENAFWKISGASFQAVYLPTIAPESGWEVVAVGDLAGSSANDLLWVNRFSGEVAIWELEDTVLKSNFVIQTLDPTWKFQRLGNFGGSTKQDIIWRRDGTGETALWEMAGNRFNSRYLPSVSDTNWQISDIFDYDGDGIDEIGWYYGPSQLNMFWQVRSPNGSALNNPVSSYFLPKQETGQWKLEQVADVTGDNILDFVWRNQQTGGLEVWQLAAWALNGSTTIQKKTVLPTISDFGWQVKDLAA